MSVILVHLGESEPPYLAHCIHQLSLFCNQPPLLILEPYHKDKALGALPGVKHIYTDTLQATASHTLFLKHYSGDTAFRKNYWRYVKERFFFIEEVMEQYKMENCVAMEYDVLLYTQIEPLLSNLSTYAENKLAMVMDVPQRGHPGFLFIQKPAALAAFTEFMVEMMKLPLTDMELLSHFKLEYPEKVCCLPVITPQRNTLPERKSMIGQVVKNTEFLSEGFNELGVLFDSAVVGQWVGGVDPRNMNEIFIEYENEEALYSVKEVGFAWKQEGTLWIPYLDGQPLATIHLHSKALNYFLSDQEGVPTATYKHEELLSTLQKNFE